MFQRTLFVRWVPRYFSRTVQPRQKGKNIAAAVGRRGNISKTSTGRLDASGDGGKMMTSGKRFHSEERMQTSSAINSTPTDPLQKLLQKAEELFERWQKLSGTLLNRKIGCDFSRLYFHNLDEARNMTIEQERNALLFTAQTEVFAVLKTILPHVKKYDGQINWDVLQNESTLKGESPSVTNNLVVIPDETADNAENFLRQIKNYCIGDMQSDIALVDANLPVFTGLSICELVVFLQLYHAVECQDGDLLLQLLEELRRIVFKPTKRHIDRAHMRNDDGDNVIPRLLLVLSELGIMEKSLLERLTTFGGGFLSRTQIAHYQACDLVRLLVTFHRFGLHHEPCFKATIKALRQTTLRHPLRSFLRNVERQQGLITLYEGNKKDNILSCMTGLTVNELLESLTAIALSLYRERSVVGFLAATIVIAVKEDEERVTNIMNEHVDINKRDLFVFRALQVLRATKICEQMELAQPILAHLLHQFSVRYGGLLMDGGEELLNPARVGFYDFITADLVKVVVARRAFNNPKEYNGEGYRNDNKPIIVPVTDTAMTEANVTNFALCGTAGPLTTVWPPGGESYADAVKSPSVRLAGVPMNSGKVLTCTESVTNSTMHEQESLLSSWADDDQCFFDSLRISWEKGKRVPEVETQTKENNTGRVEGNFRRGRGGRGWRFAKGADDNRRRKNNNNNNNNDYGAFRKGGEGASLNLHGGRFASLR